MALLNFQNEQVDTTGQANGQGGTVVQRYTQPNIPTPTASPTPTTNTNAAATVTPAAPVNPMMTLDQFSAQRGGNVNEQGIRDSVTNNMQSQIDATDNYYADLVNKQEVTNENNTGQTRAVDARSGLLGSDFGNAHAANQQTANNNATKAIRDEQSTKIAAIHGQIDSMANAEIAAKKAEAAGNADAYAKYTADAQTKASDTLKQLASSSTDLSQLDPQKKAYLYQAAGLDPAVGDLVYNSMKPPAAQLNYQYIHQADGSTLAIAPDPKNPGQFIQSTIPGASPDIGLVMTMIGKYPDAGIKPTDDLATAAQKIKTSGIYRKDTYIAPPSVNNTYNVTGGSSATYTPGQNPAVDSWVQLVNNGTKISDVPAALQNQVAQGVATAGGSKKTADILQTTKDSLKTLQDYVDSDHGFQSAVGAKNILTNPLQALGLSHNPISGTSAADFDAKLKQTVNDIVLPNLTLLHGLGRVTDREFQSLQSAMTSLSPNLSETEFKSELKKLTDTVNSIQAGASSPTPSSDASLSDDQAYQLYLKSQGGGQ